MRQNGSPNTPEEVHKDDLAYYKERIAELEEALRRTKKAEEDLREYESHLDIAQQMAHVGSWVYYAKSDTSRWSDEMYRIFGIPMGTPITYKKFLSFVHPDDRERIKREVESARRDKHLSRLDYRIIRRDGSERILHSERLSVFRGGEPDRVFGADQDITERKQMEEALIKSEEKCRTMVEYVSGCIWETDRDGHFTYLSPRSLDIIGYSPEEMVGKTTYDFMPPESAKEMYAIVSRNKAEGKPFEVEYPFRHKNGYLVYVHVSGEPTFDRNGTFSGFIGISTDITKRRLAEEQLEDARDQAEMYVDLLSHDINNMNQVAIGYTEIALDALRQGNCDPALLEKSMEMLYNSSRLIDGVKKIQKIKSGEITPQLVDIGVLLKDTIEHYRPMTRSDVVINFHVKSDCKVIACNLLRDVFLNLISNSVKHSAGPVTIDVELDQAQEQDTRYCIVAVSDNGPGIPDATKKGLFQRFARGSTKAKGIGLGLYLVKSLIENFHGRVWVEDRVRGDYTQGARFVVMMPSVDGRSSHGIS